MGAGYFHYNHIPDVFPNSSAGIVHGKVHKVHLFHSNLNNYFAAGNIFFREVIYLGVKLCLKKS